VRRFATAAVLGLLLTGVGPAPAHAHADFVASTPASGANVVLPPAEILLRFSEPVSVEELRLLDAQGRAVAHQVGNSGTRVTVRPGSTLSRGPYAVTWSVVSGDGHVVSGAMAFQVKRGGRALAPRAITTVPASRLTLSGFSPGALQLSSRESMTGEVTWMHPSLLGPLTWTFDGTTATGVLPVTGPWELQATVLKGNAVVVHRGQVRLP
jgi:methionine-rich copper-binding protein CopC